MSDTLSNTKIHEIDLEDQERRSYTGRITGKRIAYDDTRDPVEVFLTDDERVIVYDSGTRQHWVLDEPVEDLRGWLAEGPYVDALHALGESPVIDL